MTGIILFLSIVLNGAYFFDHPPTAKPTDKVEYVYPVNQ